MTRPKRLGALASGVSIDDEAQALFLLGTGLLADSQQTEEADVEGWEPHDLRFHWRSRGGYHEYEVGAYGREAPPPEQPEPLTGIFRELPVAQVSSTGPLGDILGSRKSQRTRSKEALDIAQIASLLSLTFGVRNGRRPYPSGGGRYEVEAYLSVFDCDGISPGFYRYDSHEHRLEELSRDSEELACQLNQARWACAAKDGPRILITLGARVRRLNTRYRGLCYALILKHVGVILQTLCLGSTVLDFSVCPIGTGASASFPKLSGFPRLGVVPVGELGIW